MVTVLTLLQLWEVGTQPSPEPPFLSPSPGCTDDIVTSDHSPVFGTFEVGVTSQFISKKGDYSRYACSCSTHLGAQVETWDVHGLEYMCVCVYTYM